MFNVNATFAVSGSYINRFIWKTCFEDILIARITSVCQLNRCRFVLVQKNVKLSIAKFVVSKFFIVIVRKQYPDSNSTEPDNLWMRSAKKKRVIYTCEQITWLINERGKKPSCTFSSGDCEGHVLLHTKIAAT